jgi:hypothetical protein
MQHEWSGGISWSRPFIILGKGKALPAHPAALFGHKGAGFVISMGLAFRLNPLSCYVKEQSTLRYSVGLSG